MQYFEKRYYDAGIGRFTTEDPVFWEVGLTGRPGQYYTDPQQWNSYSYVRNNPVNYTDPSGEVPVDTLVDAGFTVADASILTYYNGQAIYNQFMAMQNLDDYDVYRSYQDKANSYEEKAGKKLADLGADAVSMATPYMSAGITRSAKMALKAAEKANDTKKAWDKSKTFISITETTFFKNSKNLVETKLRNQNMPIFKDSKTGKYYTLDNLHKNHIEVFDKGGKHLGSIDPSSGNYVGKAKNYSINIK